MILIAAVLLKIKQEILTKKSIDLLRTAFNKDNNLF